MRKSKRYLSFGVITSFMSSSKIKWKESILDDSKNERYFILMIKYIIYMKLINMILENKS